MEPFTIQCVEGGVDKTHKVSLLPLTLENIQRLYDKMVPFEVVFGRKLEDINDFVNLFFKYSYPHKDPLPQGLFWAVDDLETGVFYLTDMKQSEATAHFVFFDQRIAGRSRFVWYMINKVMKDLRLERLNITIPCNVRKVVHEFVRRCGALPEGRKRKSAYWQGEAFDEILYGVCKEDLVKDEYNYRINVEELELVEV